MARMIATKPYVFRFADVTVHEREFAIFKAEQPLHIEPKTFRVLLILIQNPNKLIAKEELLNAVWGTTAVTENSLARNIALLRRLLGDDPREPRFIETVSSIGYRFICPVEIAEESPVSGLDPAQSHGNGIPACRDGGNMGAVASEPLAAGSKSQPQRSGGRNATWMWLPLCGTLALLVAAGVWYAVRPLPQLTVSAYRQITTDGGEKEIGATDGLRIYFSRNISVRDVIFEVPASGGESTKLPIGTPAPVGFFDISPDGSKFVVNTKHGHMWTVRAIDGIPLLPLPDGNGPVFSPDGRSVAYATDDSGIWLVGSDGAGAHQIASLQGNPRALAWSPDGNRIRFTLGRHIWEVRPEGSNLHQLLTDWQDSSLQCCGRWTADGGFYVFLSQVKGSISQEIWALDEQRSLFRRSPTVPIRLTTGPTNWTGILPAKDLEALYATGETQRGELSRFDKSTRQFQPLFGGISVEGTKFSPDKQSVVYVSWPDQFLFRAYADGSNPVQLTDSRFAVLLPIWSPDGTQIVFTDMRSDPWVIYVIPSSGGVPNRVIPSDRELEDNPTWSPDGKKIAFGNHGSPPGYPNQGVKVVDLSTDAVNELPGSKGMWSPRWSPDGKYIVALNLTPTLQLFDTRTQTWLPPLEDIFASYPTWSADGRWLYYLITKSSDDQSICRSRVPNGKPEVVIHLTEQYSAGWWGWFGLDPADAPIVMRDMGRHEIYALTLSHE
jgi:Tol biopolymer transport system component/DNA-binding winged helix-turn-helix (wHTH) protein